MAINQAWHDQSAISVAKGSTVGQIRRGAGAMAGDFSVFNLQPGVFDNAEVSCLDVMRSFFICQG